MNSMGNEPWQDYVQAFAREHGDLSQSATSRATGIPQTSIGRWMRGELTNIEPANVAKFAMAYGRPVLEAFVAAGLLRFEDAVRGLDDEAVSTLRRLGVVPSDYSEDQADHSA